MTQRRIAPSADLVDADDVDEVIGLAATAMNASADKLSVEDLVEVGGELGIPAVAIERAVAELEARRRAEKAAAAEAQARTKALRQRLLLGALGGSAALAILGASGHSSLQGQLSVVEQKRAQVRNVIERRASVDERLSHSAAPSVERDAERAGAENRISIERRRYDEAAAQYNAAASSTTGRLWQTLFGLPRRAPLSNEIASW